MEPTRPAAVLIAVGLGLACAGLPGVSGDPDAGDEAERARLAGDFAGAEAILQRRLRADPKDARSWRLLGDVNLTRGQRYGERWKENLGWALDAYEQAVRIDPKACAVWGRIAAMVVSAAENEAIAIPRSRIEGLPLDAGWSSCAGSALLSLAFARQPTPEQLAQAPADGSDADRLAAAAPWLVEAVRRVDLAEIPWTPLFPPRDPAPRAPFVVLEVPATGASVGGSAPRRFTHPEWQLISQVSGDRLVYLDRRFAARVPEKALTRAPGCPGTKWTLQGEDRVPVGTCAAGSHDRRASDLYDPDILRPTGPAHFHEPSIDKALIPWSTVAEAPVRCLGGPVGRQFYDTPSCPVAYDRAVPVTRSLPRGVGVVAQSEAHAELMVRAARAEALFGAEIAGHLARSEIGVGLPYELYAWAQPDLTGCRGRGIFTKLRIEDGALEFTCKAGDREIRFRELELVEL